MPFSVVVCERGCSFCKHVRGDGFIEDDREPSIILYTQLPRIPASLNPAVVRRGVRRPVEPRGDREVYSRDQNGGGKIRSPALICLARQTSPHTTLEPAPIPQCHRPARYTIHLTS